MLPDYGDPRRRETPRSPEADHDLETDATTLKAVNDQLKRRMHQPIPEQGRWLASVVRGHMAYYAVPGNYEAVAAFCDQVTRYWLKALRRRSQKTRVDWTRMIRIRR